MELSNVSPKLVPHTGEMRVALLNAATRAPAPPHSPPLDWETMGSGSLYVSAEWIRSLCTVRRAAAPGDGLWMWSEPLKTETHASGTVMQSAEDEGAGRR